ncbi:hypothetical protein ACUXAD_004145 [Ralstonia pickettii]|jgi:hypothetical protein
MRFQTGADKHSLFNQTQLSQALQALAVGLITMLRCNRVGSATDRADPKLHPVYRVERCHTGFIGNVVT